jgi:multiple sugar transport system permease protein
MSEQIALKPAKAMAPKTAHRRRRWLPFDRWHLFLFPFALVMLFPMLWMLVTSIETISEARRFPPVMIPEGIHWVNYPNALKRGAFGTYFLNTFIVTMATVIGNLVFCSLAGYAFARIKFFGREVVFMLMLATLMIPYQVTIIPEFLIVKWLGTHISPQIGIDSLGALIVPGLVQVFGIFLLRQFFRTLPIELEEAARIDGASRLGILFKIVLPLSLPALATLGALTFLWTWNDFLWPLIAIMSPEHYTIQLGLMNFQTAHTTSWTLLMAANVMSMIPLLIVFLAAQKYFIQSVATSGLKG